ncbi:NADPH-dependent F420 reductase [Pseudoscardovia radai]|uniref:NADPH-dependent F420 reductase n=1 Tax=Pseudoscardovia radai TaxID=987066 RepID=UPI0039953A77
MTAISIIGKGNMGTSLAKLFERAGATVTFVGHDEVATAEYGDIVVLAVPYPALADIAGKAGAAFDGKTVVDITNPVDFSSMEPLAVEAGSAAAELQALVPNAHVVKAFNTNFAATLASGEVAGQKTSVMVAGDDADAKKALADVVAASGATVFDAGSLQRAHEMEALGYLQISLAARERIAWTDGFVLFK